LHIEHRRDGFEEIFTRGFVIVDEGFRQVRIGVARWTAFDLDATALLLLDAIEPEDAGLDRSPGEEVDQPPRRDAAPIRVRFGGIS